MKRCLAIVVLSVFLITYLLPIATLVKADVVIGDNDNEIVNENAYILGRKIALMESIPNLLNSGATQLTITNSDDLDSYLDSLWGEINDGVSYLTSGDWIGDVPNAFRDEALENLNNYINYIDDRSNWFAELLRDPTTSLLKTYVIGNNLPKTEYKPNYNVKSVFGNLARLNGNVNPQPDPDFSFIQNINTVYCNRSMNNGYHRNYILQDNTTYHYGDSTLYWITTGNISNTSLIGWGDPSNTSTSFGRIFHVAVDNEQQSKCAKTNTTITISVITSDNNVSVVYSAYSIVDCITYLTPSRNGDVVGNRFTFYDAVGTQNAGGSIKTTNNSSFDYQIITPRTSFDSLSNALNYIYNNFAYVNLYVDGVPWALIDNSSNSTLDIDGYLKIYGNNNPVIYDIPNDTQIDYDLLYDTIYNAIINALPIEQNDITYYDSHDSVYSPTIINNYGSDSDGENDWIESILDYAIVPNFDTALVEPLSEPITNGTLVMVTGVSVIPEDILFVLGAAFVLILFACIINRMIE